MGAGKGRRSNLHRPEAGEEGHSLSLSLGGKVRANTKPMQYTTSDLCARGVDEEERTLTAPYPAPVLALAHSLVRNER